MPPLISIAPLILFFAAFVYAQPSPEVQKRISAAIVAAANESSPDYTAFVNPFIGTDNFGDVCPGASIPFGMVKFSTDLTGYAPAGYVTDPTQTIRGLSPLHDSGTGSSLGTYGNFEIMPMTCPRGFDTCTTMLSDRETFRKNNTDDASPGYFSQTLDNEIKMEATSTRRAGLERFTFPEGSKPYFVLDLSNDLPDSFVGGTMNIDPEQGRVTIGGRWGSSFGPGSFSYQAFSCYDLLNNGNQTLDEYGIWEANAYGLNAKGLGQTHLNLTQSLIGDHYEYGALFSYAETPEQIIIRVGVSFVSTDQACTNAESEIGSSSFDDIMTQSKALWNEKLSAIRIDLANTAPNVTELLYSSLYRASLTPNNATGETQGAFAGTASFYFDSLYCSWDTFRTFYPLMALQHPVDFAQIVDNYIDGWRKLGWMPECRANNLPGWTQGGSSGDVIVGHFAINYHNEAADLGIDLNELYSAMLADGDLNPMEWDIQGREVNLYTQYGYVPSDAIDPSSTGRQTREGSRTLEYAFEDFSIRQAALLLNNTADEERYLNRSLWYRNVWDKTVVSDGFHGFMQKRLPNGTFNFTDPTDCSPQDTDENRECSLQGDNVEGFYESSSWEYSWFAPHDTNGLLDLMGGNDTFVKRLDHFFDAGYYLAGNEPSFQTPIGYHYANQPAKSIQRVRQVVFENFDITPAGLPGNDDQAAMASVLTFHLLGLYPVPGTSQFLILSPFTPNYTIHNTYLNTSTTVTTLGFDPESVQATIPHGAAAYVKNVTLNGVELSTKCHFDFYDVFRIGGEVVIEVTPDITQGNDCGSAVPESVSMGGFTSLR
ncbi:glycoside hydrolase family 92 protein [Lentinula aciculospora]|uniref:Glycoside hydrolase family 92 protein n=1 Tax=Lentinula aciculospora TaxID=153920 RepID=A0A9W9DSZ8_9AGAR|nr:glycoside hydrolase family 92 protein [Lentinula aciculospora]